MVHARVARLIYGGSSRHGHAGRKLAEQRGIEVVEYPADWQTYGRGAGPIRNKQMLDEGTPDLVIAFPGGPGTANMVK